MKPISVIAAPNAEREAREGLELQLVSRKDSGSHETLSTRVANVPCSISSIEDRGARPYVAGLEVARPNEAAYSVRAPRNSSALEPSATAKGSGDSRGVALVDRGAASRKATPPTSVHSAAPRNNSWLTPTLTADEIADEDDRWLTGLQSVAIIYVFLFVLGWIGWNAHEISSWLYTHAQGIVGALLGGGK